MEDNMKNSDEENKLKDDVKKYLEEHGIMKKFFADRIGISNSMLSHWFANKTGLTNETIEKICSIIFE